jgi:hypothetical protein
MNSRSVVFNKDYSVFNSSVATNKLSNYISDDEWLDFTFIFIATLEYVQNLEILCFRNEMHKINNEICERVFIKCYDHELEQEIYIPFYNEIAPENGTLLDIYLQTLFKDKKTKGILLDLKCKLEPIQEELYFEANILDAFELNNDIIECFGDAVIEFDIVNLKHILCNDAAKAYASDLGFEYNESKIVRNKFHAILINEDEKEITVNVEKDILPVYLSNRAWNMESLNDDTTIRIYCRENKIDPFDLMLEGSLGKWS